MARTEGFWQTVTEDVIETTNPTGYDLLINGVDKYINFNETLAVNGYGFRDNGGVMETKSDGGSWEPIVATSSAMIDSLSQDSVTPFSTRPHPGVTNPVLAKDDVTDGNVPVGVADPFIVFEDGTYYMFFEMIDADGEHISYATSPDGLSWTYQAIVIDGTTERKAFPYVFKVDDTWYMTPDNSTGTDDFEIWKATSFPTTWTKAETAIDGSAVGVGVADPTPWFWDGRWYLTFFDYNGTTDIKLYVSDEGDSIEGRTWSEHPQSPILAAADSRRNGGGAYVYQNFVDVLFQGQGNADVRLARFTELTPTTVTVQEAANSPLYEATGVSGDWNALDAHHVDLLSNYFGGQQLAVVDGRELADQNWKIGIYITEPATGLDETVIPWIGKGGIMRGDSSLDPTWDRSTEQFSILVGTGVINIGEGGGQGEGFVGLEVKSQDAQDGAFIDFFNASDVKSGGFVFDEDDQSLTFRTYTTSNDIRFDTFNGVSNQNRAVISADDGFVGINTENPDRLFHVNEGSNNEVARFESSYPIIELKRDNASFYGGDIRFLKQDDSILYRVGSRISVGENNFEIYDDLNSASRFYIDPNGNVGLGQSDPQGALHVNADSNHLFLEDTGAGGGGTIWKLESFDGNFAFTEDAVKVWFRILKTTGQVRLPETNQELTFGANDDGLIKADSVGFLLSAENSKPMRLYAGGTSRLTIDSSGQLQVPADGQELAFGATQDATIKWDGTNNALRIDPNIAIGGANTNVNLDPLLYIEKAFAADSSIDGIDVSHLFRLFSDGTQDATWDVFFSDDGATYYHHGLNGSGRHIWSNRRSFANHERLILENNGDFKIVDGDLIAGVNSQTTATTINNEGRVGVNKAPAFAVGLLLNNALGSPNPNFSFGIGDSSDIPEANALMYAVGNPSTNALFAAKGTQTGQANAFRLYNDQNTRLSFSMWGSGRSPASIARVEADDGGSGTNPSEFRFGVTGDTPMTFYTNGTERARFPGDGGFQLQSLALKSSPEAGLIEYDGDFLYFTPVADRRAIQYADGIPTSDTTVSNTITETTVYTESISANELKAGMKLQSRITGYFSTTNATDTFTARLKMGSTTLGTMTSTAENVTNGGFRYDFDVTVRSVGATGTVISYVEGLFNDNIKSQASTSTTTVDTTAAEDITLTIEWSAADPSNSVTVTQGHTKFLGDGEN